MTIDLFTFVAGNGAEYAEFLKYTCEKNLSGSNKINWKCVESLNVERLPNGFKRVCKSGGRNEKNSMKHAIAMENALAYIESDYVIFVDMDVAIVYKGWDDVIINELNKYDCFGGSYSNDMKDEFSKIRYKNFPRVNFFCFRSDILKKISLDFKQFNDSKKSVPRTKITKKDSDIFEMKTGSILACDTGWKLPLIFKKNNLTYNFMPCYLLGGKKSKFPFINTKHKTTCLSQKRSIEEWHYNKKLFATHKRLSRSKYHHLYESDWGSSWRKGVEFYMQQQEKI